MAYCAIPYCNINKRNNPEKKSFFRLPKDDKHRSAWVKLLPVDTKKVGC